MFVEGWLFVLSFLFRKKDRNCLICLENVFIDIKENWKSVLCWKFLSILRI